MTTRQPWPRTDSGRRTSRQQHPAISLRAALDDNQLLGHVLAGESWSAWRTLLIAAMGERLTDAERVTFKQLTQREREPLQRVEELIAVIGRRGGKSRAISVLATYLASCVDYPMLSPGERGCALVCAPDQQQSDLVLDHIEANFRQSPILRQLIEQRTARELKLTNRIDITVRSSDFRRLRGPTWVCCIADESAFFYNNEGSGSANPDSEILNSVRPGLATTRGLLAIISSPYARRGELWRLYNQHFGANGDPLILVAQAPSRTMNPSLPESIVTRAMERDPASAASEYLAAFRSDLEAYVSREAVSACVARNVFERPYQIGQSYRGFCDPSGGSSDSFTLCISHFVPSSQTVIVDCLREAKPAFSPEIVCQQFSEVLKSYRINRVVSDRYGGIWPVEQFAKFNIIAEQSAEPKSSLYQTLLPLINSQRVILLNHAKTINQLCSLEQRNTRGLKPQIDSPPNMHDDLSNCVAGAAALCLAKSSYNLAALGDGGYDDEVSTAEYRRRRQENAEYHAALMLQYGQPVRLLPA
jgi:hypothetical protein